MNRSMIAAAAMVCVLSVWMISGLMKSSAPKAHSSNSVQQTMTVEVSHSIARHITPKITSQGHALPNREISLRAQTLGKIEKIFKKEGDRVEQGDLIATIELGSREAKLEKAKALVNERKSTYLALEQLGGSGYSAKTRIFQAQAEYKEALAQLKDAMLELEYREIRAPFSGIIDKKFVEIGDFLSPGNQVVTIVDNNPLIVTVQIPQQQIAAVKQGKTAEVKFANGIKQYGQVRFISAKAEQQTRTFRVEIAVNNKDGLAAGMSVEAKIPKTPMLAHYMPPSVLVLGLSGEVGVMTVDVEGVVHFMPVNLVSAKADGVWLSGLPESINLITRGQGFVDEGQLVSVQRESRLNNIASLFQNESKQQGV